MDHVYVVIYIHAWTKHAWYQKTRKKLNIAKHRSQEEENLGMEMGHGHQISINKGNLAGNGQYIH